MEQEETIASLQTMLRGARRDADMLAGYMGALGYVVRFDELREGSSQWTASITGVARGDGATRLDAIDALKRSLVDMAHRAALVDHERYARARAAALESGR